jgi:hypothetical protein
MMAFQGTTRRDLTCPALLTFRRWIQVYVCSTWCANSAHGYASGAKASWLARLARQERFVSHPAQAIRFPAHVDLLNAGPLVLRPRRCDHDSHSARKPTSAIIHTVYLAGMCATRVDLCSHRRVGIIKEAYLKRGRFPPRILLDRHLLHKALLWEGDVNVTTTTHRQSLAIIKTRLSVDENFAITVPFRVLFVA